MFAEDCDGILCLVDDKMSRLFAEVLLRPAGKFNLTEFLTIWEQSVPPGEFYQIYLKYFNILYFFHFFIFIYFLFYFIYNFGKFLETVHWYIKI